MAAGERAALRQAVAEQRQRYVDSFLNTLRLARCEGVRSEGGQGALCARLGQELQWGR